MEFKSNVPIYIQVVSDIKKQIASGQIKPGEKLPSTRELALRYTINPNTSVRVYSELESEQITFTRRGLGTFVSEDETLIQRLRQEMTESLIDELLKELKSINCSKEEIIAAIHEKY